MVRVATVSPRVCVADPRHNVDDMIRWLKQATYHEVDVLAFPELSITGYTCGDLFQQTTLLKAAECELARLADATREGFGGLAIVGVPVPVDGCLFNVGAVLQKGTILGLIPKSFIPNYKEFYERRWFAPADRRQYVTVGYAGQIAPFGTDLLFRADTMPECKLGVEICEDLWTPIPPSSHQALAGATVVANLSASNECTAKAEYRRELVLNQSARCVAAYVYAAAGVDESTTDLVFGGHCMIAENGQALAERPRFERQPELLLADIDIERLSYDRRRMNSFADSRDESCRPFRIVDFQLQVRPAPNPLARFIPAHPFVPTLGPKLEERCKEIFATQVAGLAKRMEVAKPPVLRIGVSGGLDSTLALLAAVKTCDALGLSRTIVEGVTMPGFGTGKRSRSNADRLMDSLGIKATTIDVRELCMRTFRDLRHKPFGIDIDKMSLDDFTTALKRLPTDRRSDLVFENVQARMRTLVLMSGGFVVGTGDMSELAVGWCTYNGDHMSMYNPNVGIPKTLVRFLVRWAADHEFDGDIREVLHDIASAVISPELLPPGADGIVQNTESTVGPYELVDFFMYHMLRWGMSPAKIAFLAGQAKFDLGYSAEEIKTWLGIFVRRFFASQFKRSCLPDGPKVGSISLSPRGDWRMPSDTVAAAWLREVDSTEPSPTACTD